MSTNVQISCETVKKLTHPNVEIRLRTLEQLDAKVQRALAHKEAIDFKPSIGELCKQLIRWFGCEPLQETKRPLNLLLRIIKSCYGQDAVEQLRVERFRREMEKVAMFLNGKMDELKLVVELQKELMSYEKSAEVDIIEIMDSLTLEEGRNSTGVGSIGDHQTYDNAPQRTVTMASEVDEFEQPWSKPSIADYNAMKLLADIMINPLATTEELQNALQHLQITMVDYPPEYMLQSPNIYLNVLELYDRVHDDHKCDLEDVGAAILVFLKCLEKRLGQRLKTLAYRETFQKEEIVPKTQLKLDKTLELLMDKSLKQLHFFLHEFRHETTMVLEIIEHLLGIYRLLQMKVRETLIHKLCRIVVNVKKSLQHEDSHFTLSRIKYLLVAFILHDAFKCTAKNLCYNDFDALKPLLVDYTFRVNFPERHEALKTLLVDTDEEQRKKFIFLEKYESHFTFALDLLKTPQNFKASLIIENGVNLCMALEKLKSYQLAECILNSIFSNNLEYVGNPQFKQNASDLLLKMMRLEHEPLKAFVYGKLTQIVKKHFVCLMNGESFCSVLTNMKLLELQIIGVPWTTDMIHQVINDSQESANVKIQRDSEDILVLFLKAKHLLGSAWPKLLDLITPILSLLQCCASSKRLMELLLELYDPDAKSLPFLQLLRGNCTLLFHKDMEPRNEALTRLMYMLNTLPNANEYVPNVMEIGDLVPNDICQLKVPRHFGRIFCAPDTFFDKSTLHNLLILLESPDIEPLIRKTTLMQLNVMCQNWDMLKEYSNEGASYITLQTLESCLRRNSISDYIDAAIPSISILSKLLIYDSDFRQELSNMPNIYILLLRSLFMYPNDIQLKEDASLCLFMLLFSSVLVVVPSSPKGVEAPSILGHIQLPLNCELKNSTKSTSVRDAYQFRLPFVNTDEELSYMRQFIAASFCGGSSNVTKNYLETQLKYDVTTELHFNQIDWRMLNATKSTQNLRRFLKAVTNATNHNALINASSMLKMQLILTEHSSARHLSEDIESDIFKMLAKYLQLPPGNEMDYLLFEHMVSLCDQCVKLPIACIIVNFTKTLQADYHHACIALLKHTNTPLRLYQKLCLLLRHLLESSQSCRILTQNGSATDFSTFYSDLFDIVFEIVSTFFEKRELQRVRCLLSLMQMLSNYKMNMPDKLLGYYCKRFLNLSVALKSSTQTGSQWQRDCLELICQLHGQMESPGEQYRFNGIALKYLSGLCGHSDSQVRALAWCILSLGDHEGIISELSYLPGGFIACCLCTLLDKSEVILVRQLAGNMYVDLLVVPADIQNSRTLLENQDFFRTIHEAVQNCVLSEELPMNQRTDTSFTTCEIISCFCRICLRMAQYDHTFSDELCEKPFMFKLYELMKMPPIILNPAYYTMCSDICQLYAICSKRNFVFLQNTLCRDYVWLASFANLLRYEPALDLELVSVINLLMVLCRDLTAYERLCEQFSNAPEHIVKVFIRSFKVTNMNRPLQKCSLAFLSYLLIKSQHQSKCDYRSFAEILESSVEIVVSTLDPTYAEGSNQENNPNMENKKFKTIHRTNQTSLSSFTVDNKKISNAGSVIIFMDLYRLFSHLCPTKSCKFDADPQMHKVQIAESMAVLLKMSTKAQEAAKNLKLFDKITNIFKIFLEEFNTTCTVFVRRYGETKKMAIINNFRLLFNIILNWFSAPSTVLTDELSTSEFTKVLMRIWSWLAHSVELKLLVLQVCSYLSERSLIVCQQFSTLISSFANSILQLVIKIATFETTTVKAASTETFPVISTALRVIMNCCACAEGRLIILKSHTLDIFDGLHPFNMKSPRLKPEILHSWLQFWELFSRYNEGGHARNLNSLCEVINCSTPQSETRILSLKVLRNMCFANSNRASLLASTDFIYTIDQIVSQPLNRSCSSRGDGDQEYTYEEQMLVCVAVWRLISAGIKFISIIRGTKLAKKLRILREHLSTLEEEIPNKFSQYPYAQDLSNVLDVMFEIFNN